MNQNIRFIDTQLLFRATQHKFDKDKIIECCGNEAGAITIIHNDYNHVFGT